MIWIYILLFVIIALIVYLIYLVRFWGRTNIELTGDTYTGLNNVLCRILNQDRLKWSLSILWQLPCCRLWKMPIPSLVLSDIAKMR